MRKGASLSILALLLLYFSTSTFIAVVSANKNRVKVFDSIEKIGLGVLNGPESMVWDQAGNLYTSIADGTVRKVDKTTGDITIYAYSVPGLSAEDRAKCGTSVLHEPLCGRPLGLQFDSQENLWIADAYKGILKVPRSNPSNVQVIVNQFNGVPFKMPNSLYLTNDEKTLYFTDTSQQYTRMQFVAIVVANKPDGRLFKLDLQTGALTVEIDDLRFANGVAVGKNEEFLAVNECSARKIRKYYLKGKKAGKNEVMVDDIGGYNDNIRPDGDGNFYVGLFSHTSEEMSAILDYPKLQALTIQYIPPLDTLSMIENAGIVKKIDSKGRVIDTIESADASVWARTAEADVHDGYLYLGSVLNNHIGRVKLSDLREVRK